MTNKMTFTSVPRTIQGKKVKKLRLQSLIPANITQQDRDSVMITVDLSNFNRLYRKVGDTGLIYLTVEGEKAERPVLVDDLVVHPVTGIPSHVVFRQVNLKEKISAEVPVEIIGESKVKDSVVLTVASEISVEALPTDLPEKFVIDISVLTEIGQAITYADLQYDQSKVTLNLGEQDKDSPVVLLQGIAEEVVEAAPVIEAGADGAATPEAAKAEGENPQESTS